MTLHVPRTKGQTEAIGRRANVSFCGAIAWTQKTPPPLLLVIHVVWMMKILPPTFRKRPPYYPPRLLPMIMGARYKIKGNKNDGCLVFLPCTWKYVFIAERQNSRWFCRLDTLSVSTSRTTTNQQNSGRGLLIVFQKLKKKKITHKNHYIPPPALRQPNEAAIQ